MTASPLITPAELAATLAGAAPPAVLDVRWRLGAGAEAMRAEFAAGHIPGAVFVDLDSALAAPAGEGGRHPLPEPATFGAAMRAAGVATGRPVVVLDAGGATSAARCWWLLTHHGHPDVRVLDGGLGAWRAAGLPIATGEPALPAPGDFEPVVPGVLPVIGAREAALLARTGVLLDARAGERYRGEEEPIDPVAGHIPGARSAPTSENLDADGRFLDAETLRRRFAAAGVAAGTDVGAYCGSGVTAAHTVLALRVAGVTAALYPGSWSGWVADRSRPVATGAEPG